MNFKVTIDSESWFYTHWRSVCHSVSVSSGVNAFAKPLSLLLSLRSVCNQGNSSLSSPSPWFGFESEYCHHVGGFPPLMMEILFPSPFSWNWLFGSAVNSISLLLSPYLPLYLPRPFSPPPPSPPLPYRIRIQQSPKIKCIFYYYREINSDLLPRKQTMKILREMA